MTPVFEQSVIINPFHVSTRILSLPRHNPPIIWLSCENVSRTRPCPDKIRKRGRERERKEKYIETTELTNCFEMWEQRSNEIDFNFVPWSTIHLPPLSLLSSISQLWENRRFRFQFSRIVCILIGGSRSMDIDLAKRNDTGVVSMEDRLVCYRYKWFVTRYCFARRWI